MFVYPQKTDSRSSRGGQADDFASLVLEVFTPVVQAWVKQSGELLGLGIQTSEVGAFVQIAVMASECQIFSDVRPAVLLGDDVFNMKRQGLLPLPYRQYSQRPSARSRTN